MAPRPGNGSAGTAPDGNCYGIWPAGDGQSVYANNCYGHDEPGIQFYSTLHGSGGNTSWNITLPIGRDFTDTQADLYTAIWFGMTLTDPFAWGDQCFLELQFYPDSDWNAFGVQPNSWVGAAVAWQIEAATGFEDTCFYDPLYQNGSAGELLMHGGDQVVITMSGWPGSPYGENLSIVDATDQQSVWVNMYNSAQHYPLDPAYDQNAFENGLQWTPGGEYPVVFAFETGHTIAPYPNTNAYGGCSSGPPPPGPQNPDVPCPSYDPASWVNDTLAPWYIRTPTFFNRTAVETPSQVSFSQDLGGIAFIDPLSNYTCAGLDGSAWCSYPWYSYSCVAHAFEFGATDYPGVTTDFGAYRQYSSVVEMDASQYQYYPPTNFSIPTCADPAFQVTVGTTTVGDGSAYFLSTPVDGSQTFVAVGAGEYSVNALPAAGMYFAGWTVNGNVTVTAPNDPMTTVSVSGNGSVDAAFSSVAPTTAVLVFHTSVNGGHAAVLPTRTYANGVPLATLGAFGSLALPPGTYSIQAYAPAGYNFSHWQITGAGASLASLGMPFTWLDIPSTSSSISLTATFVSASVTELVVYGTYTGSGTVSFDGGTATSSGSSTVAVGTYPIVAFPDPGWAFEGWYYFSSALMIDFTAQSNVTIEGGTTDGPYALFEPLVQFNVTPAGSGGISLYGAPAQASQSMYFGTFGGFVQITPAPSGGYAFSGWTVSNRADLWVFAIAPGIYYLDVNASGTVTAKFATATSVGVAFQVSPAGAGTVEFNFQTYAGGSSNTSAADGNYWTLPEPSPGYNFTGWTTSGSVAISGDILTVSGTGGSLTALFAVGTFPVTFTTDPPGGPVVKISAGIGPVRTASHGQTLWLSGLNETLSAQVATGLTVGGWTASPNLVLGPGPSPTLAILGPGTIGLFTSGFSLTAAISPNTTIDLGQTVTLRAFTNGTGPFTYVWVGLPPGCSGGNLAQLSCTPTVLGNFTITVNVTAADGTNRSAVAGTLDVRSPLAVLSLNATPTNFTLGSTTTFTVRAIGGSGAYTYQYSGLPTSCPGVDQATFTCTPDLEGRYDVNLRLSDPAGAVAFGFVEINVFPPPAIQTFFTNRPITEVGLPALLTVVAGGGTPALTYRYSGLPTGCASHNVTNLTCSPTDVGNFTVLVNVTDADGFGAQQSLKMTVLSGPTIQQFTLPSTASVNQTFAVSVVVVGGLTPYSYVVTGLPSPCTSGGASSFSCRPAVAGNFTVLVTVTDHLGVKTSAGQSLSVHPAPPPPPTNASGGTPTFLGLSIPLAIGLVALLVVAIVVGAVLIARRRRAPPPRSDPADEDPA